MKTCKLFLLIAATLFAAACEDILDTDLSPAERLEGRWKVDEDNQLKTTDDFYEVYIDIDPVDSNTILISGFYDIHNGSAYATISGFTLNMPTQDVEGFSLRGSATISVNYKQMNWLYYVDDGRGEWTEVRAIYTKIEEY